MVAGNKLAMENPPKDCIYTPAEVVDGTETLYGQQSIRVIGTTADDTHFIMWRLPDFSCETVQAVLQRRSASGEWETILGSRLVKFAAMDPPKELLSGFASYKEMPPRALVKDAMRQQGVVVNDKNCPSCKDIDATCG